MNRFTKWLLIFLLLVQTAGSAGCVVAMIAAVRWDQRRWKAMQKAEQEALKKKEAESDGTPIPAGDDGGGPDNNARDEDG